MVRRTLCLFIVGFLAVSCKGPAPQVTLTPGASLAGRELVLFEFGNAWLANHSVVQILSQEVERRGMVAKLQLLPGEILPSNALVLHLDHAGDQKEAGSGRIDFLRHLKFSLRDASGNVLGEASYSGGDLDRLEQKKLIKQIADQLFAGS
jgi:hypothetical protein